MALELSRYSRLRSSKSRRPCPVARQVSHPSKEPPPAAAAAAPDGDPCTDPSGNRRRPSIVTVHFSVVFVRGRTPFKILLDVQQAGADEVGNRGVVPNWSANDRGRARCSFAYQ